MCEVCQDSFPGLLIKGGSFGGVQALLYSKPVKKIADKVEDTVGLPKEGVKSGKKKMKKILMESGVYIGSSLVYDQYIYSMIAKWLKEKKMSEGDIKGVCKCELIRMLYNLIIQQVLAFVTKDLSIRGFLADALAIFGAEMIGNKVNEMLLKQDNNKGKDIIL